MGNISDNVQHTRKVLDIETAVFGKETGWPNPCFQLSEPH